MRDPRFEEMSQNQQRTQHYTVLTELIKKLKTIRILSILCPVPVLPTYSELNFL